MSSRPPQVHRLVVLYGSETGCAQDAAERVAREAGRRGFACVLSTMNDYDVSKLPSEKIVIFVASTTGDGEVPSNMKQFWKFLLRKAIPHNALSDLSFGLFGLGDSSYPKFNAGARKLHTRLQQLGATEIAPRGLGDELSEYGIEGDLDIWLKGLWNNVLRVFPIPEGYKISDNPELIKCRYNVLKVDQEDCDNNDSSDLSKEFYEPFYKPPAQAHLRTDSTQKTGSQRPFFAPVVANNRLTATDWSQNTRGIKLDLTGSGLSYNPGDVAVVWPQNASCSDHRDQLMRLSKRMNISYEQLLCIQLCADGKAESSRSLDTLNHANSPNKVGTATPMTELHRLPKIVSFYNLINQYLDVLGQPKRTVFEQLSFFATDPEQAEKLLEMASPEGADLYFNYIRREKRTFVELLEDFNSIHLPLDYFLELVPALQPRQFSIASSFRSDPTSLELCVAQVEYLTPFKRRKFGICSTWLSSLRPASPPSTVEISDMNGSSDNSLPTSTTSSNIDQFLNGNCCQFVPLCIIPGMIHMPADTNASMILIGPGTGIAPMRSLVQERQSQRSYVDDNYGSIDVYFGCRKQQKDFYYAEEWPKLKEDGTIQNFYTAFSRDKIAKEYVQLRIWENRARVRELLTKDSTYLFISGSAKRMPNDVADIIIETLVEDGTMTHVQARSLLAKMSRQGRYIVEAWS